jgi:tRNA(Ile)-lysidine synthase TilS/MesJ
MSSMVGPWTPLWNKSDGRITVRWISSFSSLDRPPIGTFCGVFRRQALDRGAASLGVDHIVTGHNADDIAETVLMNSEY